MRHLYAIIHLFMFGLVLQFTADGEGGGGGSASGDGGGTAGSGGAGAGSPAGGSPAPGGGSPGQGGAGQGGSGAGSGSPAGAGSAGTPPSAFIGQDGKFGEGFKAKFPELAKKFTEPEALAASYASLEKMINAKGIIKPGPNATPQQVNDYWTALGRPATAAEYGLKPLEKITIDGKEVAVPKELWEAETASKASELFHKLGLTTEQAHALTQFDMERGMRAMGTLNQQMTKMAEDCVTALKSEWPGQNFDRNLKAAQDQAAKLGLTKEILNARPHLANDPVFIQAMYKVAAMNAEQPAAGARGSQHAGRDPAAEIAAIYADRSHPWHPHNAAANPKAHADAVKHMQHLYRLKHGEI